MKITLTPLTSVRPAAPPPSAAPGPNLPQDSVTLQSAPPSKAWGTVKKMASNLVTNAMLGALPAIGTAAALALGGPNAAGVAIAASMVGTGLYTHFTAPSHYSGKFAGGALLGGLSAACGCLGWPSQGISLAVGPAVFAGFGAARECVKWMVDLGENHQIDASLR